MNALDTVDVQNILPVYTEEILRIELFFQFFQRVRNGYEGTIQLLISFIFTCDKVIFFCSR